MTFRQFAVLVRDRHQAFRLAEFFDQVKIPYINQRSSSLVDSPALQGIIDIVRAVLHPHDRGAIRTALGNPIIGWSYDELKELESLEPIVLFIHNLRVHLFEKGFAAFFQTMLYACCHSDGRSILEHLLSREDGLELFHDLQQIADIITDHQYQEWNGPEGIIPFLDQFQFWEQNDDERVKRFQNPSADAVKILTLHVSKGLEFDVSLHWAWPIGRILKKSSFQLNWTGNSFCPPWMIAQRTTDGFMKKAMQKKCVNCTLLLPEQNISFIFQ